MKKPIIGALLVAGLTVTAAVPANAAVTVVPVSGSDLGVDWHAADTRKAGTLEFTQVADAGAAKLSTTSDTADKVQLLTDRYDGLALADITELSYTAYRDASSTGFESGLPALNLRVDHTGDGLPDAYFVYEPYADLGNAAVRTGEWQDWDAIRGGAAEWWVNTGAGGCGQGPQCTWAELLELFPEATIEEATNFPGSLGLNLGTYNANITGAVDKLVVNGTVFDFDVEAANPHASIIATQCGAVEIVLSNPLRQSGAQQHDAALTVVIDGAESPYVVTAGAEERLAHWFQEDSGDHTVSVFAGDDPLASQLVTSDCAISNKDECKNGRWATDLAFKNQGQCVSSFVKSAGSSKKR